MDKKPFDFKDLMAFGMFILALLTFVFANLKQCIKHRKTTPVTLASNEVVILCYLFIIGQPLVGGCSFSIKNIAYPEKRFKNIHLQEKGNEMIFRKEVYLTRDINEYNRAKDVLADKGIEYTSKSNPMTNPGRFHGTPFINASAAYEYHLFVAAKDKERAEQALQSAGVK